MLEQIERRSDISKADYKAQIPALRHELVLVQQSLRTLNFPVIVVFAGVDGAGKHETADLLNAWMDPRWLRTHAYGEPSDEERERPEFWRFWRDLPPNGQIGFYLSAWYSRPLLDRVKSRTNDIALQTSIDAINAFERTLVDNGALLIKYWMHLDQRSQRKRLEKLASNPLTSWEVKPKDWEHWALYSQFVSVSDTLISATNSGAAEWTLIDASAERARGLDVARHILAKVQERASAPAPMLPPPTVDTLATGAPRLADLDMAQSVERGVYKSELAELRARLGPLQRAARAEGVSAVLVFEGADAAGKGGAIRRITGALDARHYQVIPIAAPTDEEHAHHYLWRFWRHIPRQGRVTIYDRSWYGRVLVERVEGFCSVADWQRAYDEINQFERAMTKEAVVICKFWLHISDDEQLRRFDEREQVPYKAWKLTDEDWRNRERWSDYELAVDDMVRQTNTDCAPWTLVEGNQKYFARLKVLRTVCESLERALGRDNA
ncbi:MAG: polyphosphate:AMP phosphotransferase [Chromatiales bacterium]|jgi:AMP-polyphosphate phosphotransferase|nr:polyphosphate:AMP phosphotransferase [Chromatiales bacterium]